MLLDTSFYFFFIRSRSHNKKKRIVSFNAPREMLIEKTDLEEETVDEVLRILKQEFEEENEWFTILRFTIYD